MALTLPEINNVNSNNTAKKINIICAISPPIAAVIPDIKPRQRHQNEIQSGTQQHCSMKHYFSGGGDFGDIISL